MHLVFLLAVEEMLPLVELEPEWRPKIFDAIFGFWPLLRYLHVVSWDTHPRHQSLQKILKKKIRKEFFLLKNLTFHNLDSVRKRLSVIFFFQGLHGLKKPCQAQLWLIFIISNYFQNRHFSTHLTQNYTATVDDMGKKKTQK